MPIAPDTRTLSPPFRVDRSPARTLLVALSLATSAALSACNTSELPSAPEPSADLSAALHRGGGNDRLSKIEQFALAQGTYCNDAADLPCSALDELDVGFIWANSRFPDPASLFYTVDIGGVNARWWARNRPLARYPRYEIDGDVRESRLADGRRRLRISAKAENTFTFIDNDFYDADLNYLYTDRLLGADFFEYPGVDPDLPDLTPQLADVRAEIDLILPAGFVGMPDLAQLILDPAPGMEFRRLDVWTEAEGRLRSAYKSFPEGTRVRIRVRDNHGFALTPQLDYPGPDFTIERARGGRDDRDDAGERKSRHRRDQSRRSHDRTHDRRR